MASRLDLQAKLEELLNSENVYFDPPESVKIKYPAIRFTTSKIESRYANDAKYSLLHAYDIVVIDPRPNNAVIDLILALPYSRYDLHYKADNLHHDVITLYF